MTPPAPELVDAELFRALGALAEPPRPGLERVASALELGPLPSPAAHHELFAFQLVPHAAIYLGPEGMLGGEAADRVSGFWRALGQQPPSDADHVSVLLALYAELGDLESTAVEALTRERWLHARTALLWEHLLSWLPLFLLKLEGLGEVIDPFYRDWARLLAAALREEAANLPPAAALPLALRAAPPLGQPEREGAQAVLAALFSPIRVGLIVTRADLARAGEDLGLGCRVGDRRLALRALLEQDIAGVLDWLATTARAWQGLQSPAVHGEPRLASFWQERAQSSTRWLLQLRLEALAQKGAST
jgi:TorA maturation chaperone TorD